MSTLRLLSRSAEILSDEGLGSFLDKSVGPNSYLHRQIRRLNHLVDDCLTDLPIPRPAKWLVRLPILLALLLFENWALARRTESGVIVVPTDAGARTFEIPSLRSVARVPGISEAHHGTHAHRDDQREKYTLSEFVDFSRGDTVVDVGAYVGSLALEVGPEVGQYVAIDPTAAIDTSLVTNTSKLENVTTVPIAAWNESGALDLNLSLTSNDNSVLAVDSNRTNRSVTVWADTVASIAADLGIERIDFLKIEAEGAEPEVLEGALKGGSISIGKIVIDCAPERDGESPRDEIEDMLSQAGYVVRFGWGGRVVYAKKPES